eukprot:SAG31_NODE_20236_length_580_cov_1.162162_2_plen_54_part_01
MHRPGFEQSSFQFDGQLPAIVMRGQTCCDDPEWGNRKANTHMAWSDAARWRHLC